MYSSDLKLRAINLYNKLKSYRKVSCLLDIGKSTIHRWVNNIHNSKNYIDFTYLKKFIKSLIHNNNCITLLEIKKYILDKYNKTFSISFIYNFIIKNLKYSYKKISKKMYAKNINDIIKKQKKFRKSNQNYSDIICIDETYIQSNCYKQYGWSPKGKPLTKYIKSNPIKYSIIMAISNQSIIKYEIHKTNIQKTIFKKFMTSLNKQFKNKKFLMDNVSFHKSKEVSQIFNNSPSHREKEAQSQRLLAQINYFLYLHIHPN